MKFKYFAIQHSILTICIFTEYCAEIDACIAKKQQSEYHGKPRYRWQPNATFKGVFFYAEG